MQTILIIDDDETIGDLEQEVLTRAGYQTLRAYAGTEALLLLKEQQPDLILLDLMLPGLSGEALLPKLAGIPVIVVSAKAAVADKVSLLLGGAADYLTKPFETEGAAGPRRRAAAGAAGRAAGGRLHLRPAAAGHRLPRRHGRRRAGGADADGIRDFKAAAAKPRPGPGPVRVPRPHQRRYAGLHRALPPAAYQQPAPQAGKPHRPRLHRSRLGHRLPAETLTKA